MKILNLVKSEFKKNFSIKKMVFSILILLLSTFFILKFTKIEQEIVDIASYSSSWNESYRKYQEKENKNLYDNYMMSFYKTVSEGMSSLKDTIKYPNSWQSSLVFEMAELQSNNDLIKKMMENPDNLDVVALCNSGLDEFYNQSKQYFFEYEELQNWCHSTSQEIKEQYQQNENKISKIKELLENKKYYLYLQYEVESRTIESDEFTEFLIQYQADDYSDFRVYNYIQYQQLLKEKGIDLPEKVNKKIYEKIENDRLSYKALLLYSSKQGIKHDIIFNYYMGSSISNEMNSKMVVNQVYHLSFVIMILISIMYGGIVSNEHSKGTIKNLISAPVRRWKILASKFIYLVLTTYFLWLIGLVLFSLFAGIKYGFNDLLTPKLIYSGGKVLEVNFYLYTLKNILIASIPVLCFLALLFFLSTVTLSTAITTGITSIISIVSPFLWILGTLSHYKIVVYTPIWYLDCGFIFNDTNQYMSSLVTIFYHWKNGVIISLIVGIILYVLTTLIYIKRDIKN